MNKIFLGTLSLSLIVHAVAIILISAGNLRPPVKPLKPIEVNYQKMDTVSPVPSAPEIKPVQMVKMETPTREIELLDKDVFRDDKIFDKISDISKISRDVRIGKKQTLPSMETADIHRKITIPELNSEKISSPHYLTYTEAIRALIRSQAYHYIDAPDLENGDVYMTFILGRSGQLKALRIIEERSLANDFLRKVGVESIEAADPFPPFPQDLNFQELTFNIKISFQVN